MNICDFCSAAKLILSFLGESSDITQTDLMYDLFGDFLKSEEGYDFDFDNGLVCRWFNGTAKISPRIISYYSKNGNVEGIAINIEEYILPLFYDKAMAVGEIYNLLMNDTTVSENKKLEILGDYPFKNDTEISDFISRVLLFAMNRPFIKRDARTNNLLSAGALSPVVRDYIYDVVPKPCRHFCGRGNELGLLHSALDSNGKVFVQGVAGIGKSEFAKKYAQLYKKDYTNILYFRYSGDLKKMITECDFADDRTDENDDTRFKRHNRFLRSLKEDTLIIIDNFNTIPSDEPLFDVVMKYRCKIVFTTRSRFNDYAYFELTEMREEELTELTEYFYRGTQDQNSVVPQIISEVHNHTLSVELAARLLASGILEPYKLLKELQSTKAVLCSDDKINLIKDGRNTKATYYEHIHKLVSLFGLSEQAVDIMRNMPLVPYSGINPRLFAKWIGLNNLNAVNELIEYGFIQTNENHKITLHPLIREIAIDDTKPSVENCNAMTEAIRSLCLHHGLDLPYHNTMFEVSESIIKIADKDNAEKYLLFLKDVFPYMEKYAYRYGMELIIGEMQKLCADNIDRAMLLDYKAAYEHICNRNNKKALQYEQQAAKLCDEIISINPYLVANIFGNMGGLYHAENQLDKARLFMEKAYEILTENNLQYTNDAVIQICNYANLAADMGEPKKAIRALLRCAAAVKECSGESTDYANLLWNAGCTYLQIRDIDNALVNLKKAIKVYAELWIDEPELLQMKRTELEDIAAVYGMSTKNLIN